MTEGKPQKILITFSLPILLSSVFQQLYNIIDSIVAGKYIGEDALAAIGASYPITMIFMSIAFGCNVGCSVIISQLFGSKNIKDMKLAVNTSFVSVISLSLILTVIGLVFCNDIISLINTPENIFSDSALYLRIYIGGLGFLFLYNICTGIFTALGDSRTPLYFLIFSSVGNIILDLIFVIVFKMGISGVAFATFLMQGISSVLAFITLLLRLKAIPCEENPGIFSFRMLARISKIAVPSILQQSFVSIGNILIQGIINQYGSAVIAGYSAAIKLNTFAITSFATFSNALSSFTAQNIGAGKIDRVKKGYKAAIIMGISAVLLFSLAYIIFGRQLINLFMDSDSNEAISVGVKFLMFVSPFYFSVTIKLITDGLLRGAGAVWLFIASTFTDLIIRVILSFVLNPIIGYVSIPISWFIGWLVGMSLCLVFYFSGIWKKSILC